MEENSTVVRCPQCGSTNVQFVTRTEGAGYNGLKGCLGAVICLPLALCGFDKSKTQTVRKCMNCGREF